MGVDLAAEDLDFSDDQRLELEIENDSLYRHATAQFNFTTYNVSRERDVINPSTDKCNIMLATKEDTTDRAHPFWYARVLGIFHARVTHPPLSIRRHRIPFLFIRWFGQDSEWRSGDKTCRLPRVGFVPFDGEAGGPAFGFIDPATVIRGCHLIPAYAYGKTKDLLPPSAYRDPAGDWVNYYVNWYAISIYLQMRSSQFLPFSFATRDMYMRYVGFGVGHVDASVRSNPPWPEGAFDATLQTDAPGFEDETNSDNDDDNDDGGDDDDDDDDDDAEVLSEGTPESMDGDVVDVSAGAVTATLST